MVYNPLAGGLFSGKYTAESIKSTPTEGRYSDTSSATGKMYRDRYFKESTFNALSLIEPGSGNGRSIRETIGRMIRKCAK